MTWFLPDRLLIFALATELACFLDYFILEICHHMKQVFIWKPTLFSFCFISDIYKNKPVHPKGNQPWIFIRRTDVETPILWPPDAKSQLIGKDRNVGKDWRQKEKGMTEDEMVRWHHRLNGHEFGQTPGESGRQRTLACYSPWSCKELQTT